jgi:LysM repeat protein
MTTPRHPRLLGLAATLAIAGILIGLPTILLQLGWGTLPAVPDPWWLILATPDDGHLALLVIKAAAWVTWALLAISVATELIAALRGVKAPQLPGLHLTQRPAQQLVATAMLLFVALPTIATTTAVTAVTAAPAAVAAPRHVVAADHPTKTTSDMPTPARALAAPSRTYTVQPGDSLWTIAERYLGAGQRYHDIVALNADLLGGHDDFLTPGWVLTLPADTDTPGSYTVRPGDTLSDIARSHLGDESHWHDIYEASRHTTQPDHGHLNDPDLILPGWTLTLPPAAPATDSADGPAPSPTTQAPAPAPTPTPDAAQPPASTALAEPSASTAPAVPPVAQPAPAAVPGTAPVAVPTSAAPDRSPDDSQESPEAGQESPAPWLLAGLTGAGALLAGGLLGVLRRRRQAQFRARRPGRAIAAPPLDLAPVEKTIITTGAATAPTLQIIDQTLRSLAATMIDAWKPVPDLEAVQLLPGRVGVHLAEPVELPAPWEPADSIPDGRRWTIPTDAHLDPVEARAPYPQLVTVGQDDDGATWLVNLEHLGTVSLTGDPTYAGDFARYLAAEIAVNPWSTQVQLHCVGVAPEAAQLDPARIHHHRLDDLTAIDHAISEATDTIERSTHHDVTVVTGRASDLGEDVWPSQLVLLNGAVPAAALEHLLALIDQQPHRTGTAVVLVGDGEPIRGVGVRLTDGGRVQVPTLGLDLVAVGLTPDEAAGCALLMAHADQLDDVAMPAAGDDGWRQHCDAAGALRPDLVLPRDTDPTTLDEPAATVLPADDHAVLQVAAAVPDDLDQLAPLVPAHVTASVESTDETLDADVDAWFDPVCPRPRLSLLGPISAHPGTHGNQDGVLQRRAMHIELLSFIALHPNGVTLDQVLTAFGGTPNPMRGHLSDLRGWLGRDPATGQPYLPGALWSPAARQRGIGVYQVSGVLVDIDLFRRLRRRGQARGADGLADYQRALQLVQGEPFTGQRQGGWSWLADGVRVDQHLVCGIVDVAHLVTMAALTNGDLHTARTATETAILAAPYEDTPQMDLAAIIKAEGDQAAAHRLLIDNVANRSDDGEAPADLPPRTIEILQDPRWAKTSQVA